MDCSKDMIGRVNLDRWRQLSPNFVVPDEMLHESIERAKRDLGEMRHTEWNLHEHREYQTTRRPSDGQPMPPSKSCSGARERVRATGGASLGLQEGTSSASWRQTGIQIKQMGRCG